jgi:hypothetical protein
VAPEGGREGGSHHHHLPARSQPGGESQLASLSPPLHRTSADGGGVQVFIKAHLFYNSDANPDESINRFSTFLNAGPAQVDKGLKRLDELHRDMVSPFVQSPLLSNNPLTPHPLQCQVMPGADDDMNTSRRIAQSGGICSALYQRNFEGAVDAFSKLVKSEPYVPLASSLISLTFSPVPSDFKDSIVIVELYPKRKVHHSDRDYSFVGTNDRVRLTSPRPLLSN